VVYRPTPAEEHERSQPLASMVENDSLRSRQSDQVDAGSEPPCSWTDQGGDCPSQRMTEETAVVEVQLTAEHSPALAIQLVQLIQHERYVRDHHRQMLNDESFHLSRRDGECLSPSAAQLHDPSVGKYSSLIIVSVVNRRDDVAVARELLEECAVSSR